MTEKEIELSMDKALKKLPFEIKKIKFALALVKFFKRLREKFKISILFITHDLSTLKNFADKIYVMYHGEIVDEDHPYRKQLFQLSQDVWRRTK